jgi:hypothetical protein
MHETFKVSRRYDKKLKSLNKDFALLFPKNTTYHLIWPLIIFSFDEALCIIFFVPDNHQKTGIDYQNYIKK